MATNEAFVASKPESSAAPVRRDDLVLEELDGAAILYDPRYGAMHRFNAVTLFVWDLCDGSHTMTNIVQRLMQMCEVHPDEALDSVHRVIAELRTLDLLQVAPPDPINKTKAAWWTKAPPTPFAPSASPTMDRPGSLRLSRRELLGSGMGKLMFVAPVISTFFAAGAYASGPSASAAFSTDANGGCKTIGYSCAVNNDCCEDPIKTKCDIDSTCCIQLNEAGCTTLDDCCNPASSCTAGTCLP